MENQQNQKTKKTVLKTVADLKPGDVFTWEATARTVNMSAPYMLVKDLKAVGSIGTALVCIHQPTSYLTDLDAPVLVYVDGEDEG